MTSPGAASALPGLGDSLPEGSNRFDMRFAARGRHDGGCVGTVVEKREGTVGAKAVPLPSRDGNAHASGHRTRAHLQCPGKDVDDLVLRMQMRTHHIRLVGAIDAE